MEKYIYVGNNHISFKKRKKLEDIFKKLTSLMHDISREDGNNKDVKKQILEEKLIEVIKTHPEIMYMLHYGPDSCGYFSRTASFAYYCLEYGYLKLFDELCNNKDVCTMQMWDDKTTIGYLALMDRYPLLMQILEKHPDLIRHQTKDGNLWLDFAYKMNHINTDKNIINLNKLLKKVIMDDIACLQVDKNGNNIGMLCAKYKNQELFELAYKNPEARKQVNKDGDNMAMIANNNGLIVPPLSEEEVKEFYTQQIHSKVDEICR